MTIHAILSSCLHDIHITCTQGYSMGAMIEDNTDIVISIMIYVMFLPCIHYNDTRMLGKLCMISVQCGSLLLMGNVMRWGWHRS